MADGALITTSALDYRAALPQAGALLGLDLGTQTIGTAFCDAGWRFASPGKTLKRGKFGGYRLAKPAGKITIGQVVRVIDGPLAPIGCVSQTAYEKCTCPDEAHCGLRMLMLDVRNAIAGILDRYTLADVVETMLRGMLDVIRKNDLDLAERLVLQLNEPMMLEGMPDYRAQVSVGLVMFPDDGESAEALLRHADQAMYLAKQAGKNRYQLLTPR